MRRFPALSGCRISEFPERPAGGFPIVASRIIDSERSAYNEGHAFIPRL